MKKILFTLIGLILGAALTIPVSAQGSLSNQVLRLLDRPNTWTALQTYDGSSGVIKLTRQTGALGTRTDRLENIGGNLYFNGTVLATNASAGTVTSVDLTVPSFLSVTGNPITSSGTLAVTLASQTQNKVLASPNGSTGTPAFRALVAADIPSLPASQITSGVIAVANGGTGLTAGTSGGILYYSATGTLASSGVLTANRIVLGGGAATTPTVLGSLGTSTTVLHGNGSGAPTFSQVALTTDVSGTLPATSGGTGLTSFTSGGVPYFSSTTAITSSGLLTNHALMVGGGAGAAPSVVASLGTSTTLLHGAAAGNPTWAQVNLGTEVTSALGPTNGGTGIITYAQGDLIFSNATNTLIVLPKSSSSTRYLSNTGTTNNPAWAQVALATGVSGILPQANGGTGITTASATDGQLLIGKTSDGSLNLAALTGTSNQVVVTNGGGSVTLSLPQSIATASTPQWARIGLGTGAGASALITGAGQTDFGMVTTASCGAAATLNWNLGTTQKATLDATNCTLTLSNPISGNTYTVLLVQDGTGGRTVTWPGTLVWRGGNTPTLSTTAGVTDRCYLVWNGSAYLAECFVYDNVFATRSITTVTSTGTVVDLDYSDASTIRMNNATAATIHGLLAGVGGQILDIVSIGAGNVVLSNQSGTESTASRRIINNVTGSITLAAGTGRVRLIYDTTTARWRVTEFTQGAWLTPGFSAGDFTAASGSWTVASGDVTSLKYMLKGSTLTVSYILDNTTLASTPSSIRIGNGQWGSYTAASAAANRVAFINDNGSPGAAYASIAASGTYITIILDTGSLSNSTDATDIYGQITFDVQ